MPYFISLILLISCSSTKHASRQELSTTLNFDPLENRAKVHLFRKPENIIKPQAIQLEIDGAHIASLPTASFTVIKIPKGLYKFTSSSLVGHEKGKILTLFVKNGVNYFIEVSYKDGSIENLTNLKLIQDKDLAIELISNTNDSSSHKKENTPMKMIESDLEVTIEEGSL